MQKIMNLCLALLALCVAQVPAWAQYPDRPVRILVGAAAGGPTDIVARVLGDSLGKGLGKPVLVDNRAGAGGNIASQAVATSAADGYTLLMGSFSNAVNPAMMAVGYDARRDLMPVSQITSVPLLVVTGKGVPFATLGELVAEARKRPGAFNIASGGIGSSSHMAAELFKRMAGVDMPVIHYKGGAPALQDVLAERVQLMFDNPQTSLPHVKAGGLKLLAVSTAARLRALPNTPTVAEGPGFTGFEVISWHGIFARSGTPPEVVGRLTREIAAATSGKDLRDRFAQMEIEPVGSTPVEFGRFFAREMDVWARIVKEANIKPE